jgi:hypothetical protein
MADEVVRHVFSPKARLRDDVTPVPAAEVLNEKKRVVLQVQLHVAFSLGSGKSVHEVIRVTRVYLVPEHAGVPQRITREGLLE